MTAPEPLLETRAAAEALGIPESAIWDWKTRRKVTPAGLVRGRGRGGLVPLYRLSDLRPLAEAYLDRKAAKMGSMPESTTDITGTGFVELLRAWQVRVCEHLGLHPDEVFRLNDNRRPHGHVVSWRATSPQSPTVGRVGPAHWSRDGENPPVSSGKVVMTPDEWSALIGVAGEKPELMTRDQELVLKGMAAESAADRATP